MKGEISLGCVVILLSAFCCVELRAALPDILNRCCDLGRQWFTTNRESCTVYSSAVIGVQSSDRSACGSIIDVCCIAQRHDKQCSMGKQSARIRRSCEGLSSRPGSEQARECCHCCNLGITAHEAGLPCTLMSRFSPLCDAAFMECCEHGRQTPPTRGPSTERPSSTPFTTVRSSLTSSSTITASPPTRTTQSALLARATEPLGICSRFPGMLCAHVCVNTPDSYECACHDGYTLQSDRRSCRQEMMVNRCESTSNPCQHRCLDTGMSLTCRCFDGFVLEADGRSCSDIDECLNGTHACTSQQSCDNIQGSYRCHNLPPTTTTFEPTGRCTAGYTWNQTTKQCIDINECSANGTDPCGESDMGMRCMNTPGSFLCLVGARLTTEPDRGFVAGRSRFTNLADQFQSSTSRSSSVDDVEIRDTAVENSDGNDVEQLVEPSTTTTTTVEPHQQQQQNNRNQYERERVLNCGTGFAYSRLRGRCEDINECALNRDTCIEGQTCENTIGSYACRRVVSCGTGYTLDQASQRCIDDDECLLRTHNCGVARDCNNIPGSFRCVPKTCPRGYRLDFHTGICDPIICPRGHEADDAGNCIDIDECQRRTAVCRANQECRNTQGSYICRNLLACGAGYELNSEGSRCEDVDECAQGTHDCTGALMHCVNRQGSYLCQCAEGFQVNHVQRTCEDIDECTFGGQLCSQNARCENTHGSYRCVCKEGFEHDSDGHSCRDIDECARAGMCQHTCRNIWGSFQCSCDEGYELSADGRTCDDVDECREAADRGMHVCIGQCENTHGSFACSCPPGYQMGPDGRTCQDIDECALRSASCNGPDDVCINTRGGYKCQVVTCPKGFIKSPVNGNRNGNVKCQRKTFLCPQGDVDCLYAPLSYSTNFITFPGKIRIPADLFTMRGPLSPYRRLTFDLKLIRAQDPRNGQQRVSLSFFTVNQLRDNEAVIQLLNEVDGPQDIELQLDMNIYSREFQQNDEEVFFGTAVAKIFIFVTGEDW